MKELYRVLTLGVWASIQVSIKENVTQEDHVSYYSRDLTDRLKEAGFEVLLIPKSDLLELGELEHISVDLENEMLLCRK